MASIGQFEVPGNSETGIEFTNTQRAEISYTFSPSGTWSPDRNNPSLKDCTAEGFPSLNPYIQTAIKEGWPDIQTYMKYPAQTPYALVAQSKTTGAVTQVVKQTTIVLKPGETLCFVLNDVISNYADNSGSIKVEWSARDSHRNLAAKVIQFNGNKNYIRLPDMEVNYSDGITVEAWVWFDSFGTYTRILEFCTGFSKNTSQNGIILSNGEKAGAGLSDLVFGIYQAGENRDRIAPSVLEQKKWTHVAATVDASGNGILYKDGQQLTSQPGPIPAIVKRTINTLGGSLVFANRDFKGKMAEVRLWNKARTREEIQADISKRLTGSEPNLVGYWPLSADTEEGPILRVADLTDNFPGIVTGAILVEDSTFPF